MWASSACSSALLPAMRIMEPWPPFYKHCLVTVFCYSNRKAPRAPGLVLLQPMHLPSHHKEPHATHGNLFSLGLLPFMYLICNSEIHLTPKLFSPNLLEMKCTMTDDFWWYYPAELMKACLLPWESHGLHATFLSKVLSSQPPWLWIVLIWGLGTASKFDSCYTSAAYIQGCTREPVSAHTFYSESLHSCRTGRPSSGISCLITPQLALLFTLYLFVRLLQAKTLSLTHIVWHIPYSFVKKQKKKKKKAVTFCCPCPIGPASLVSQIISFASFAPFPYLRVVSV